MMRWNGRPRATLARRVLNCLVGLLLIGSGPWQAANSSILIVAPHSDDDIIIAAGVAHRSVGIDEVNVVYMCNGDSGGGVAMGLQRQGEAVAAQTGFVGTVEDNLIFLGYPGSRLAEIFDYYPNPTQQYFTPFGQGETYGNRGLGRSDYHTYRFGAPAIYNGANILLDLRTVISTYRPQHIFTTSRYDQNSDHSRTYWAVKSAIADIRASDPSYLPVLHSTIVWSANSSAWPVGPDPGSPNTLMPGLETTPLNWADREQLDVPEAMQDRNLLVNPKFRAIQSHASQAGGPYLSIIEQFALKDEIFWAESPALGLTVPVAEAGVDIVTAPGSIVTLDGSASRDPGGAPLSFNWSQRTGDPVALSNPSTIFPSFAVPAPLTSDQTWSFDLFVDNGVNTSARDTVIVRAIVESPNIATQASATASSETGASGQYAASAIDGFVGGYPELNRLEWASAGQRAGAWLRLDWPEPMLVDRVKLFDRPNPNAQVTGATLTFSDGSILPVGVLDNDARMGRLVTFTPRVTTSVTFTVTSVSASTGSAGLSEIQVFGVPASEDDETAPSVPGNLAVSGTTTTSISLSWSASTDTGGSGLAGYRIYKDGSATPLTSVTGTTFTDSGLTPETSHSYRVTAYDVAGNESAAAGPVSGTTQAVPDTAAPSIPQNLQATNITTNSVTLTWSPSTDTGGSGLAGYRIYRDGALLTSVTGTTFTDTGLAASTRYRYRVAAYDNAGNQSVQSSQVTVNTRRR